MAVLHHNTSKSNHHLQLVSKGKLTSHCICANKIFPHLGLAHFGAELAFRDRPVMTEQSTLRWRSILMFGSSPGGMATGSLQRGPGHNEGFRIDDKEKVPTIRSYSVILEFVVFGAAVGSRLEMVGAEGICAVLALEG